MGQYDRHMGDPGAVHGLELEINGHRMGYR